MFPDEAVEPTAARLSAEMHAVDGWATVVVREVDEGFFLNFLAAWEVQAEARLVEEDDEDEDPGWCAWSFPVSVVFWAL